MPPRCRRRNPGRLDGKISGCHQFLANLTVVLPIDPATSLELVNALLHPPSFTPPAQPYPTPVVCRTTKMRLGGEIFQPKPRAKRKQLVLLLLPFTLAPAFLSSSGVAMFDPASMECQPESTVPESSAFVVMGVLATFSLVLAVRLRVARVQVRAPSTPVCRGRGEVVSGVCCRAPHSERDDRNGPIWAWGHRYHPNKPADIKPSCGIGVVIVVPTQVFSISVGLQGILRRATAHAHTNAASCKILIALSTVPPTKHTPWQMKMSPELFFASPILFPLWVATKPAII